MKQICQSIGKIGVKVLTKVTNMSIKENLTDSQSGLRAYQKKVLQNISLTDSGMGISTEILIKSHQKEFRIVEVPIQILYGKDTSTHNPVSHGTSVLLSTIKYTSIQHPLKFYGIPAVIFLLVGYVIYDLDFSNLCRRNKSGYKYCTGRNWNSITRSRINDFCNFIILVSKCSTR